MSTPTMQEVLINRDDLAGQLKEMRELLTRKELAFDNLEAERNGLRKACMEAREILSKILA